MHAGNYNTLYAAPCEEWTGRRKVLQLPVEQHVSLFHCTCALCSLVLKHMDHKESSSYIVWLKPYSKHLFGSYLFRTFHFSPSIVKFSLFFFCTWRKHTSSVTKYNQDQSDKLNADAVKNTHTCKNHPTSFMASSICLSSSYRSLDSLSGCTITSSICGNS